MVENKIQKKVKNVSKTNWKRKTAVYLGNFVAGIKPVQYIAGKTLETTLGSSAGYSIGNPVGAIVYGGLDLAKNYAPDIKESKYVRLLEAGGTAYYGLSTIGNLFGVLNGDFGQLAQLPFNVGMLYETGTNTAKDYRETGATVKSDLKNVKKDFEKGIDYVRGIFNKDSSLEQKTSNKNSKDIGLSKKEAGVLYVDPKAWKDFSKEDKIKYLDEKKEYLIREAATETWGKRAQKDLVILEGIYGKVKIHDVD